MKSVLQILAEGADRMPAGVLLVGGYALAAHGVARQTVDVDLLVSDESALALHAVLSEAGYGETGRTENFVRYSHASPERMDVDLILVDAGTFGKLRERSRPFDMGAVTMLVPCLAHLIGLKLHAIRNNPKRELRDLGDIVELLRSNPGVVSGEEIESLCGAYGPDGIHEKLMEYL